ncbi:MAG TPA: hypothetical protein VJH75_01290 [Patescibacteria group bacterium]|nr:hypothetical protein [Patescibacteria group bacterium]
MSQEQDIKDLLEMVSFIKDNGPTKEDLQAAEKRLDGRIDKVEARLTRVESQMVTKEYLDEKLSDLRGDLVILVRKEDTKFMKLLEILKKKKVIDEAEAQTIGQMEPFPQLAI